MANGLREEERCHHLELILDVNVAVTNFDSLLEVSFDFKDHLSVSIGEKYLDGVCL